MTLPFDTISNTGVLLPLFHEVCKGFKQGKNPTEIVDTFFKDIRTILVIKRKSIFYFDSFST